jgi:hypothetical protein
MSLRMSNALSYRVVRQDTDLAGADHKVVHQDTDLAVADHWRPPESMSTCDSM